MYGWWNDMRALCLTRIVTAQGSQNEEHIGVSGGIVDRSRNVGDTNIGLRAGVNIDLIVPGSCYLHQRLSSSHKLSVYRCVRCISCPLAKQQSTLRQLGP
jgi:hypothetical protein